MNSTAQIRLVAAEVSDTDATWFETTRPRLFGIAYRVLHNAAEADDVVQETWIRWQRTDRTQVRDATAFLVTTTTRLAINVLQSAHARRETQVDTELVDAIDAGANPSLDIEQTDEIDCALRLLLAKLSPPERAAYVLREAFDYPYRRISQVIAVSEANARQLVTRARRRLCGDQLRPVTATEHRRLLDVFVSAAQTGELTTLERLLAGGEGGDLRVAA